MESGDTRRYTAGLLTNDYADDTCVCDANDGKSLARAFQPNGATWYRRTSCQPDGDAASAPDGNGDATAHQYARANINTDGNTNNRANSDGNQYANTDAFTNVHTIANTIADRYSDQYTNTAASDGNSYASNGYSHGYADDWHYRNRPDETARRHTCSHSCGKSSAGSQDSSWENELFVSL